MCNSVEDKTQQAVVQSESLGLQSRHTTGIIELAVDEFAFMEEIKNLSLESPELQRHRCELTIESFGTDTSDVN